MMGNENGSLPPPDVTPWHIEAMEWAGIAPPAMGHKTTCPECSDYRIKRSQRCLSVYTPHWGIAWRCHHCGWSGDLNFNQVEYPHGQG